MRDTFLQPDAVHDELLHLPELPEANEQNDWTQKLRWLVLAAVIMFAVHTAASAGMDLIFDWFGQHPRFKAAAGLWVSTHDNAVLVMPDHNDEYLLAIGESGFRLTPLEFGENRFSGTVECLSHDGKVGTFDGVLTNKDRKNVILLHIQVGDDSLKMTLEFIPTT